MRRQGTRGPLTRARARGAAIQGVYAQCGGITNAPSAAEAQNAPWPSSACEAGSTCTYGAPAAPRPPPQQLYLPRGAGSLTPLRAARAGNPYYWQCAPPPAASVQTRPERGIVTRDHRVWRAGRAACVHRDGHQAPACSYTPKYTARQARAWRAGERPAASARAPRRCLPMTGAARVLGRVVTLGAGGGANATSLASYQSMAAVAPAAAPAGAEQGCTTQVPAGRQCGGRGMSCYGSQCQARARPTHPAPGCAAVLHRRPGPRHVQHPEIS